MKLVLTALSALALSACGTHTYTISSHDGGWEGQPAPVIGTPTPTVVTAPPVQLATPTPSPVVPKPIVTPTPVVTPPAPKPTKGGCK